MKNVYVFIIPNQTGDLSTACVRCRDLIDLLTAQSIPFIPINVVASPENQAIWENVKNQCQGVRLIFPAFFIQDDDDGSGLVYIPGRDFYTPLQAVEIIKNNI